jgi:hypothetical protein
MQLFVLRADPKSPFARLSLFIQLEKQFHRILDRLNDDLNLFCVQKSTDEVALHCCAYPVEFGFYYWIIYL